MDNKQQCQAMVWSGYNRYRCSKNAKVEREGKCYCNIHDPVRIAEKRKIKDREFEEEYKLKREKSEYKNYAVKYCKSQGLTLEFFKEKENKEKTA